MVVPKKEWYISVPYARRKLVFWLWWMDAADVLCGLLSSCTAFYKSAFASANLVRTTMICEGFLCHMELLFSLGPHSKRWAGVLENNMPLIEQRTFCVSSTILLKCVYTYNVKMSAAQHVYQPYVKTKYMPPTLQIWIVVNTNIL